jgi:hypothetical protein
MSRLPAVQEIKRLKKDSLDQMYYYMKGKSIDINRDTNHATESFGFFLATSSCKQ